MDRKILRTLMYLVYCIPFVYLAMRGDISSGTMSFYGLMLLSFAILCVAAIHTDNIIVLIVGNVLSFLSSYLFILLNQTEQWDWYFKPFTAFDLLLVVSSVVLVVQLTVVFIFRKTRSQR